MTKNDHRFDMKIREDELEMLKALAEARRCSASQVVRELVRAAYAKSVRAATKAEQR